MASPQKENGYTAIANEILEQMARTKLNATQYRILFVIWRYTYGFNRKEHELSLSFIANATGCDKRQLQRELKNLQEKKIICQETKSGAYRKIMFNKHYKQWVGESTIGELDNGELDIGESVNTTIGESVNTTIGESDNTTIGESDNQERKIKDNIKENIKENIYSRVIDYLNEKVGTNYKYSSAKTKACIDARVNEGYTLEDFTKVIDNKVYEWKGTDMEKFLRPETLFGNKFEGYLNQKEKKGMVNNDAINKTISANGKPVPEFRFKEFIKLD